MKTSITTAATAATPIAASVSGNVAGSVASVTTKTGYSLASTGLDAVLVDGITLPKAMQIQAAVIAGKITDAGTSTEIFVGLDGATTRATFTVDSAGNRSAATYNTT